MARRTRNPESSTRRKGRARRNRPPADWPPSERRASDGSAAPAGGRVVMLTAARRRALARNRTTRTERGRTGRGETGMNDFYLASCIACARAGGRVLTDYWKSGVNVTVEEKGRNDFVTIVDRRAEEAIVRIVRDRFPDHAILAEESAPSEGTSGYRWFIDPLDGTTNYIHGYPLFSVSVGVADPQGMRAAAVYDPIRDEMFTAARGGGAYLNDRRILCSKAQEVSEGLLVTGVPFRSLARLDQYLASFRAFILSSSGIRRDGSAALNLAYVACGRYDGFWEMSLSAWDVAAGSLIVKEAGGTVTDFEGGDRFIESGDIIAANPHIHGAMLRTVRAAYQRD